MTIEEKIRGAVDESRIANINQSFNGVKEVVPANGNKVYSTSRDGGLGEDLPSSLRVLAQVEILGNPEMMARKVSFKNGALDSLVSFKKVF